MARTLLFLTLLSALILAFGPGPSLARAEAEAAGEHKANASAGEKEEMNLFKGALDLSIWTIAVFLLLLFVLSKYAWKPLIAALEHREKNISSALEEAKAAREEAQRLQAQLAEEAAKAQDKVRETIDQARRDAEKLSAEMMAKAKADIQSERDRLRREIDLARDQAVQVIWGQAADLATLISSKAIRKSLSAEDHKRLVDEAIGDLARAGKKRQHVTTN